MTNRLVSILKSIYGDDFVETSVNDGIVTITVHYGDEYATLSHKDDMPPVISFHDSILRIISVLETNKQYKMNITNERAIKTIPNIPNNYIYRLTYKCTQSAIHLM